MNEESGALQEHRTNKQERAYPDFLSFYAIGVTTQ